MASLSVRVPTMEKDEEPGTVVELLLREPQIVAWLENLPLTEDETDDDEPPRAA